MSLSISTAERPLGHATPRYYVKRVLAIGRNGDGDGTVEGYSITSGPYPDLISAWLAAGRLRDAYPAMVFVAGEMCPQEAA